MYTAKTSTTGIGTNQPDDDWGDSDDGKGFLPVSRLRRQYMDYLTGKALEIEEQKEARHYYHAAQWTAEQVRIMRARGQPIITYNRVGRKINGICGLIERMRQDPKAFPRKPSNEDGAEVATATVRYVLDGNDWKTRDSECLRQAAIEGIAGVELKLVAGDKGDPDIDMRPVFGDDYFYDPRSYRYDFSDKMYDGLAKWLDVEEAVELFPDQEETIRNLVENGNDLTTHADREFKWIMTNEKRVRLVEHWYKYKGRWCWCFYIGQTILDEGMSPFIDERGKTISRFIMFSACVDHDGDRYGFPRNLKGAQDEMNQRRSKALHISNSRRLIMDKGAVDDVETARREWARADGVVEKNKGFDVKTDDTQADLANQLQFLNEARNEIDAYANVNPQTYTGGSINNLSGKAISLLQAPGIAELGPFIMAYRGWKLRVYRAIWGMAQRYWTGERWIRVTGDENLAQFIKINGLDLDEYGRPAVVNALGALDVDIIMDEGPDVVSMMQDTFDVLKNQPPGTIPPQVLIELSPIQGTEKQKILKMMQPPIDPAQQIAKRIELEGMAAEVEETRAAAMEKRGKAMNDIASAAEHASKAHLNALEVFTTGAQQVGTAAQPVQTAPAPTPGAPPAPALPNVTPPPAANPLPFAHPPA
jgi:hypothetical protein